MHRPFAAASAVVLALALALAGCGGTPSGDAGAATDQASARTVVESPTSGDRTCRAQWEELGAKARTQAATGVGVRRAFASRWSATLAGISYYATTARSEACGDLLAAQRASLTLLRAVTAKALPYDIERRAAATAKRRSAFTSAHPGLTEPVKVARAHRTLAAKAPVAAKNLSPALTELAAADPGNAAAVKKAMADIHLLAGTSNAYQACTRALDTIAAFQKKHRKKK